jgi:hypothetical protein
MDSEAFLCIGSTARIEMIITGRFVRSHRLISVVTALVAKWRNQFHLEITVNGNALNQVCFAADR